MKRHDFARLIYMLIWAVNEIGFFISLAAIAKYLTILNGWVWSGTRSHSHTHTRVCIFYVHILAKCRSPWDHIVTTSIQYSIFEFKYTNICLVARSNWDRCACVAITIGPIVRWRMLVGVFNVLHRINYCKEFVAYYYSCLL